MARLRTRSRQTDRFGVTVATVSVLAFAGALWATSENAPDLSKSEMGAARSAGPEPLLDQHFIGCKEARAAGRENIPISDPSYRDSMDGDGDGFACEPYR